MLLMVCDNAANGFPNVSPTVCDNATNTHEMRNEHSARRRGPIHRARILA